MIRLRRRDAGFHHTNIEAMIFVAIMIILAAVALPQFMKLRDKRAVTCLNNLLLLADGTSVKDPVCPVGKKGYAPAPDAVACPAPEKHLESAPSLIGPKEGPRQLRQTLPPSGGKPVEFKNARLEVRESPGRRSVLVKPGGFQRFFFAPLMFLFFLVVTLVSLGKGLWGLWTRRWWDAIVSLFGCAVAGTITFLSMAGVANSQEWVLERPGARVTRVEYFFGSRRSEQTIPGCLGVVPTVAFNGHKLWLVHPPDAKGSRTTEIGLVAEDRLDVAEWFHRALIGP